MATSTSKRSRRAKRQKSTDSSVLRISIGESNGKPRWLTADVVDHSEGGIGVSLATPLDVGVRVQARGRLDGGDNQEVSVRARVAWCLERRDGTFRAGLQYETPQQEDPFECWSEPHSNNSAEIDHYEALQLSQCADPDTLHRVYRLLAQRYHPDNGETGNEAAFKQVLAAYNVLKDPERRAAYDAERLVRRKERWRILDQTRASHGMNAERRQRQGLLELLYAQRLNEPEQPFLTIHDLEDLLAVPRDHLQVTLWYLKEKGFVTRSDNGRYSITVAGFDEAEVNGAWRSDQPKRIPAPASSSSGESASSSSTH